MSNLKESRYGLLLYLELNPDVCNLKFNVKVLPSLNDTCMKNLLFIMRNKPSPHLRMLLLMQKIQNMHEKSFKSISC